MLMNFVKVVTTSLAIGVGVAVLRAKAGERLRDAGNVAFAILAISMAAGLAVLMGVEIHGISD